ncbi:MAG: hypothetical protein KTR20_08050 [Cellvibrionaceae bacterium]|nr:hypothetical protein [Cellvibrionaceae bacterium]
MKNKHNHTNNASSNFIKLLATDEDPVDYSTSATRQYLQQQGYNDARVDQLYRDLQRRLHQKNNKNSPTRR